MSLSKITNPNVLLMLHVVTSPEEVVLGEVSVCMNVGVKG